jgi:2'-5' RNA ligase
MKNDQTKSSQIKFYFVGVPVPDGLGQKIIAFRKMFPEAPRLNTEPHITLIPPIAIESENQIPLEKIRAVAGAFKPFDVRIGNVGIFANRVVYLEADSAELSRLHSRLAEALGYTDRNPYKPHITLINIRQEKNPALVKKASQKAAEFFKPKNFTATLVRIYLRGSADSYQLYGDISL